MVWKCVSAFGKVIDRHVPDGLEHLERVSDKHIKKLGRWKNKAIIPRITNKSVR